MEKNNERSSQTNENKEDSDEVDTMNENEVVFENNDDLPKQDNTDGIEEEIETEEEISTNLSMNQDTKETTIMKKKDVKRPSTSFFIFLNSKRAQIIKENPNIAVTEIPKIASERYKNLSLEEKAHYDNLAKFDKERYNKEVEENKAHRLLYPDLYITPSSSSSNNTDNDNGYSSSSSSSSSSSLALLLPIARIKRIIKLDKEVKNISKEALTLITKTTELFIGYLANKTNQTAMRRKGKTLKDTDLFQTIYAVESLYFLRLDMPRTTTNVTAAGVTSGSGSRGTNGSSGSSHSNSNGKTLPRSNSNNNNSKNSIGAISSSAKLQKTNNGGKTSTTTTTTTGSTNNPPSHNFSITSFFAPSANTGNKSNTTNVAAVVTSDTITNTTDSIAVDDVVLVVEGDTDVNDKSGNGESDDDENQ